MLVGLAAEEGDLGSDEHPGHVDHHFFVDGVIWKIRNPKVASPLLVGEDQSPV